MPGTLDSPTALLQAAKAEVERSPEGGPRVLLALGALPVLLFLLFLCGCAAPSPGSGASRDPQAAGGSPAQEPASWDEDPSRPRIRSRPLAVLLFPVQLVPDLVANGLVALYPGNLWPIQYLLYPISVPYWGITDAWEGRPFWDPSALHE